MEGEDVIHLGRCFEKAGLPFWIDGGWGVDALLGRQTRGHSDLDLAVNLDDLPFFEQILQAEGYARVARAGDPEWNWVLQNASGQSVDLHGFVTDGEGNGILGDPDDHAMYPSGALCGSGVINGVAVRCVAAPFVLAFRNGFDPRDVDRHDVAALCARFGLAPPSRFRN